MVKPRGVTLIELLVGITISAILAGVIVSVLKMGFDVYGFSQEQALLEKALDETLDDISGAGFENYGIKDSLQVLDIKPGSIAFVPMWVDDTYVPKAEYGDRRLIESMPFTLGRPVKAGTSIPLAYVIEDEGGHRALRRIPVTFVPGNHEGPLNPDDRVFFNEPVPTGKSVRFIYQPDAEISPDCAMTIKIQGNKILRIYNGKAQEIPRHALPEVMLSDFGLKYFDNTNTEIRPDNDFIPDVTAVKISLTYKKSRAGHSVSKTGFTFINLRNTRPGGAGLLIRQGTRIRIPDFSKIRMLSITNVSGIKDGGAIELQALSGKGAGFRAVVELGFDGDTPVMKSYRVEYPIGNVLYSEKVNLPGYMPLNFLNLGSKTPSGAIKMQGEAELVVTKMDARGAMLFIRP